MNTPIRLTRRSFLNTAAAALAAPGLASRQTLAAVPAAHPWLVACRDAHLKITGQSDCWAAMRNLGVDGVEVQVNESLQCPNLSRPGYSCQLGTPDEVRRLQDDFARHGKVITAFCMNNHLDERLEEEIKWARRLVRAATQLKVRAIRIDVVPRKIAADQFLPFAVQACRRLCEVAAGTEIRYAIENHGRMTNDPVFLESLFDRVGSPQLGLTLDAMNFYWYGHPLESLYPLYEKFAPRVYHTHCKNLRYPEEKRNQRRPIGWEYGKYAAPLYDGDIDYPRVAKILRQADYAGDLCLENECVGRFPRDQQVGVLKQEIAYLRNLV